MDMDMDMDMNDTGDQVMSMPMYFSNDIPVIVVFKNWIISDTGTLAGSCVGVALVGVVYELIKRFRYHFAKSYSTNNPNARKNDVSPSEDAEGLSNWAGRRNFWFMHLLNSLAFLIQVFTSYLLMLIVMTYNYWLFISVVLGLSLGYFAVHFYSQSLNNNTGLQNSGKQSVVETVDLVIQNKDAASVKGRSINYDKAQDKSPL